MCITSSVGAISTQSHSMSKRKFRNLGNAAVESLMYVQICTHPNIAYIVELLGRYLSNIIWKAAKRGLMYLQSTRVYMLTYRESD